MIRETCSCGATFETDDTLFGHKTAQEWRENHKHDEGCAETLAKDVAHWKFKYEQCNAESAKRRERVNELKAELILLKRLGSGNPDTPPSSEKPDNQYDYDEGYCDCWRCDDSCQNSTENGTVVTANADNLEVDGERRQGEPPVGTPVWFQGEWWVRFPEAVEYFPTVSNMVGRFWHEMQSAVAALTPDEVRAECNKHYYEGKQVVTDIRHDSYDHGFETGFQRGREDAAKAVEASPTWAVSGMPNTGGVIAKVIHKDKAVRAARGDK